MRTGNPNQIREVVLIRHGRIKTNGSGRYIGYTDHPVMEEGIAALEALRDQALYPEAEAYFTSTLRRTRQTLRILYGQVEFTSMAEFCEYHFGEFESFLHEELVRRPEYIAWIEDETGEISCPGGECRREFEARVAKGWQHLLDQMEARDWRRICLVCHGGVIGQIMQTLFPGRHNFYEWQPDNGRGYRLFLQEGRRADYKTICD